LAELSITKEERLKRIRHYISRMRGLSTTAERVLEACNNPRTSPNYLSHVISLDPVLTGRVLRVVNSAYYSLPRKVTSLTRAIIMLGLNTVKNLVLSTALLDVFRKKRATQALFEDDFWVHSIGVGVIAKFLAEIKGVPAIQREEYFVAGLLHDLGKVPLSSEFTEEYTMILKLAKIKQHPLYQEERVALGLDHCVVGRLIAEEWQLGSPLDAVLSCHHNLDAATCQSELLASTVALANAYANIYEIGSAGDFFPDEAVVDSLPKSTGIAWSSICGLQGRVLQEIEKARIFLHIDEKKQTA